ncbi:MAG: AAA family ATPase [Candidatus Kapabacteria bacterium]|nr:AAA family ATPase [Candidatus Kapabacteria bacterium]
MRILRLSFKNIASFRSDKLFTLDFTTSPLSQHSLFLITGSTGAGKSTLLDAITVALYNKYSREKSTNNFLSSLASNAIVEVEYEKDGTEYRNVWKINRSRDKLDGALQQSEMQLSLVKTNEILSSKKTDVIQKTTEILGLDFEQFTKTIILPQGDFANFLHAKDDVKIELFEKITDTKKYREFSQFVFERNKNEENKLRKIFDAIGNFEPMNQEHEQNLLEEINQLSTLIEHQKIEIERIKDKQQQLRRISELTLKVQSIEAQLKELLLQNEHIEMTEIAISRAQNANEILTILHNIKKLSTNLELKKGEIQNKEREKIEHEIELERSNQELEKIRTSNSELQKMVKQLYDKLPNYRDLVTNINTLTETIQREEKESLKLQEEFTNNENTTYNLKEEISKNVTTSSEIEEHLQQQLYLETALVHIEQISSSQKQIIRLHAERISLQESITKFTQEINENLLESQQKEHTILENERKKLPHTIYSDSSKFIYEQLKDFCSTFEVLQSKNTAKIELEDSLMLITESLKKSNEVYEKTAREFDTTNERITIVANEISQLSLEVKLQEYRTQLIEGQPCPLCGSLEHSFDDNHLTDDSVNKQISSLKIQQSELESSKSSLQKLLHNEEQLQQQYSNSIETTRKDISSINEEIHKSTVELQQLPYPIDNDTFATIQTELLARDNNKYLQFQIDSDLEQIKKNTLEIVKFQDLITGNQLEIKSKDNEIEQISNSIQSIKQIYPISNELSTEVFIKEVETMFANYNSLKNTLSSMQQAIAVNTSKNNLLKEENTKLIQKITEFHSQIKKNKSALASAVEEKAKLFGEENIENQHQVAHKELQTSFTKLQTFEKQHQVKTTVLNDIKNAISTIQKDITFYIVPAIEELTSKKSLLENTYNFVSEEEIYTAAMDDTTIQVKKNEVSTFKQSLSNLNHEKLLTTSELEQAIQSKPSETIEELSSQLSEIDTQQSIVTQELGAKNLLFQQNEERKVHYAQYKSEYEQQKNVTNRWNKLNLFIGSNDGKKYQRIVQRITLSRLLEYTNLHLKEFSNRYSVSLFSSDNEGNNQSLDLLIQDNDNFGKLRQVSTLSGGETFLVSLSMALGIATMISSTTEVESLFLDEGFGTLDSQTLEMVMQTLENLQQKGRKIGIISHVEQLKERISTQIVVQPIGNGTSTVIVRTN